MPDPINIQNWIFNAVSVFLIVEGVVSVLDSMSDKNKTTLSQARSWLRSILMVVAAIIIFWLTHSTEVSIRNVGMNRRNNYGI